MGETGWGSGVGLVVDGKRLQHEPAGVAWGSVGILRKGVWGKPAGPSPWAPWFWDSGGARVAPKMGT